MDRKISRVPPETLLRLVSSAALTKKKFTLFIGDPDRIPVNTHVYRARIVAEFEPDLPFLELRSFSRKGFRLCERFAHSKGAAKAFLKMS